MPDVGLRPVTVKTSGQMHVFVRFVFLGHIPRLMATIQKWIGYRALNNQSLGSVLRKSAPTWA